MAPTEKNSKVRGFYYRLHHQGSSCRGAPEELKMMALFLVGLIDGIDGRLVGYHENSWQ
jgi:hypothetical protein